MSLLSEPLALAKRMAKLLRDIAERDERRQGSLPLLDELPAAVADIEGDPPLDGPVAVIHDGPDRDDPLFLRVAIDLPEYRGFADIALQHWLGQPVIGLSQGIPWDPKPLLRRVSYAGFNPVRWFSYNFRDVALFCTSGQSRAYVDAVRSLQRERLVFITEADFLPWSVRMTRLRKASNRRLYEIFRTASDSDWAAAFASVATTSVLCGAVPQPCVRPINQVNLGWCLPAAMQSLLEYHGFTIEKDCLAAALGLHPDDAGIFDSNLTDALTLIEAASKHTLQTRLEEGSSWTFARAKAELDNQPRARPFISLGGHARTVAGYGYFELQLAAVEGLMSADPWGATIWWETFDASGGRAISARP